jgi:DNA polymerase delta subunit 1
MTTRHHKPIYVEQHNFLRPPIDFSTLHDTSAPLTFMIVGIDDCNSETTQWEVEKRFDERVRPNYWQYVVRLFGVDVYGHSVSAYVKGFKPFLYVQAPPEWNEADMEEALEHGASTVALEKNIRFSRRDVALIEKTWRTQFYGFTNFEQIPVMKLDFNNVRGRENFIRLCDADRTWSNYEGRNHSFWLWDACVPALTQFSSVTGIMASMWVTLAPNQYTFRDSPPSRGNVLLKPSERRTRTQLDVDCTIEAATCDHERPDIARFLIECYDIEVSGEQGHFPEPDKAEYPVIQIGSSVQWFGDPIGTYAHQCCFCLRETENLCPERVKIYWFETEAQLLEAYYYYWTDCVEPDMRVAFNQYGFDGPYLYNRYLKLLTHMIPRSVREGTAPFYDCGALDYGKVRNCRSELQSSFSDSRAHGGSTKHTVDMPGRVELDVMVYAREEWKLIVGLNVLAANILGDDEQKDDIHFSQITPLWNGTSYDRGRLAKYCVRDTELPLMIVQKKVVIIEQIEKSRLTGVSLHVVFNRKQTVRIETLLFRRAHLSPERYSIPQEPFRFIKDPHVLALFRGEHGREGALVLPANANFYAQPICTLDFSGLYPSIIRGYLLCYTSLILDPKYLPMTEHRTDIVRNKQLDGEPYRLSWAKLPPGKKPLLYTILTDVLNARSAAKKKMKQFEEGSFNWSIFNGRQLALKIVANSVYGYTVIDHDKCKLPCAAIGITVTHFGRQMINTTREEVHRRIPGSVCVYGDTDSVMIKFSDDTSPEAFRAAFTIGKQIAKEITALFPPEVELLFEKVYYPYILYQQKNYAGVIYTDADGKGKVKCAGLASVKSDTIGLVRRWTEEIVTRMLQERDYRSAKQYLIGELIKYVRLPIKTEDVAISIKMSKEISMYNGNNEVATVAAAIAKRDPGRAPGAGHKVTFVHCLDKQRQLQRVPVDVEWFEANRNRYIVDRRHYLNNLMMENVGKLFDLPTVAQDPYQWFVPFDRALQVAQNGGGIAQYLKPRANATLPTASASESTTVFLTDNMSTDSVLPPSNRHTDVDDGGEEDAEGNDVLFEQRLNALLAKQPPKSSTVASSSASASATALETALTKATTEIVAEATKPTEVTEAATEAETDGEASAPVQNASVGEKDDTEFPLAMFRDTAYQTKSATKKKRIAKAEKKQFEDECRRVHVSIKAAKVTADKRKLGLPISQFFKVRKIDKEDKK